MRSHRSASARIAARYGRSRATGRAIDALVAEEELPSLDELKKAYVRFALERHGGNKRRAAAALGIGRRTLYRHLELDED